MRNGTCSRCNSGNVYRQAGHPLQLEKVTLKPSVLGKTSAPDRYACTSCGHVEFYISSAEDLQAIRDHWERVTS
jgi:ribosomal protein S27AE